MNLNDFKPFDVAFGNIPVPWNVGYGFSGLRIRITLMRIRIQLFTFLLIQIRILLLIKVMRICDHWSTDSPEFHFEPPGPSRRL